MTFFSSSEKFQENGIITNYVLPDVETKQEVGCFEFRNCATFANCPPETSDLRYNTEHMADSRNSTQITQQLTLTTSQVTRATKDSMLLQPGVGGGGTYLLQKKLRPGHAALLIENLPGLREALGLFSSTT